MSERGDWSPGSHLYGFWLINKEIAVKIRKEDRDGVMVNPTSGNSIASSIPLVN